MTRSFTWAVTVEDALAAIGSGARPVAGGTDLVVGARQGKASLPEAIVAIDRIESLGGIVEVDGGLHLGTLATHEEIVANEVIRERFSALADASAIVGSHATRAHGTIGGNVMNASPAMDAGGPLLCFDASAT
jgi:CO/xanthine dehydrogenase FAD-binding subunit